MSRDERVDAIDFIINVLREHEKNLDTLVAKLENMINVEGMALSSQGEAKGGRSRVKVAINKWPEFCEKSMEPQVLTFNVLDDKLEVFALKDDVIYVYREKIPNLFIGSEIAKSWISKELGIEGASIIFGSIET